MVTERKDLKGWRLQVRQMASLGFGSDEIYSNLIHQGVCEEDAALLIEDHKRGIKEISPEERDAAKASFGCLISIIILGAFFLYILLLVGSVIP